MQKNYKDFGLLDDITEAEEEDPDRLIDPQETGNLLKNDLVFEGLRSIFNQNLFFDVKPLVTGSAAAFNSSLKIQNWYSNKIDDYHNLFRDYYNIGLDLKFSIDEYENKKSMIKNKIRKLKRAV